MMKKNKLLKTLLLLTVMLVGSVSSAIAADFTLYGSSSAPSLPIIVDDVTVSGTNTSSKNGSNQCSEISGIPSTKIYMISLSGSGMLTIDAGEGMYISSITMVVGRNSTGESVSQFGHGGFSNDNTNWSEISALSAKGCDYGSSITVTAEGNYRYYSFGRGKLGGTSPSVNAELRVYTLSVTVKSSDTRPDAPISWSAESAIAVLGETNTFPTLTNNESLTVSYASSNTSVATIDATTGEVSILASGKTTISATYIATTDGDYKTTTVSYDLTVSNLAVQSDKFWKFSDSGWASITTTTTIIVDNLEMLTSQGTIRDVTSANSIDGVTFTKEWNIGKANSATDRVLHFLVAPNSIVTAYGRGNGSSGNRYLTISPNTYNDGNKVQVAFADNSTPGKVEYIFAAGGDVYVYGEGNTINIYGIKVEPNREIDTQELGGVKEGETTLTETTDYTVSETTITLTAAHKTITAPDNIVLINHITYTDETTKDEDVTVTFSETASDGYFVGTATIGETEYTVKVPVNTNPAISLSATNGSITKKSYETTTGSVTVTLTGQYLTEGIYDAPTAVGVTITPKTFTVETDGTVNQEFTITTTETTAESTEIVFTCDNAESQTYTLTYTKPAKRDVTQVDVTEETTWDWANAASEEVLLTETGTDGATVDTDPKRGDEFLLATLPEINNDENFNSQALLINCQYAFRTGNYMQGNQVKFTTTVAGTVQVWFSNTSKRDDNDDNRRYLYINGTNTDKYSLGTDFMEASMTVTKGEVVINAYTGNNNATMIRIQKIVFTPLEVPASVSATIANSGYTTYCSPYALSFENVENLEAAYVVTASTSSSATLTKVTAVPAGTGVILKGMAGEEVSIPVAEYTGSGISNILVGTLNATPVTAETVYVVSGGKFMLFAGTEIPANKAYLPTSALTGNAPSLSFDFGGETTGINSVERGALSVEGCYTLDGRRVAEPTKGLYIVNGRKVIIK